MDGWIGLVVAVLLVRVGQALMATGLSRSKNSSSALVRILADLFVASLAYVVVGSAIFSQNRNPILGFRWGFFLGGSNEPTTLLIQTVSMLTASAVIPGALAERSRFQLVIWTSAFLAGVVLPVCSHWVWRGWLAKLGLIDVGGVCALLVPAAVAALVGTKIIGARHGKYHKDGSTSVFPGHALTLASIGALLVLVGWTAYVAASAQARQLPGAIAAAGDFFAAMSAGAAAMLFSNLYFGKIDLLLTLIGMLGGLVAGSATAGMLGMRSELFIGAIAGVIVPWSAVVMDLRLRIDDPVGLIAPQLVGGTWGLLAGAVLVSGSLANRFHQLGVAFLALVVNAIFALAMTFLLFQILKSTGKLRPRDADEFDGLDLAEHDIGSYPDFQHNTIRSYDLREA